MRSREDYNNILRVVSEVSEIETSEIFSSKKTQEHRDCRWMIVQLLSDMGYYPSRICALTGLSARTITRILSDMRTRKDRSWKMLRQNLDECRSLLGINTDSKQ